MTKIQICVDLISASCSLIVEITNQARNNEDMIQLSYNVDSETFTIIKPDGHAVDQEFYDIKSIKEYIAKI